MACVSWSGLVELPLAQVDHGHVVQGPAQVAGEVRRLGMVVRSRSLDRAGLFKRRQRLPPAGPSHSE